jgi:hypothetical protein
MLWVCIWHIYWNQSSKYNLDLVGLQEVVWDKGSTESADYVFCTGWGVPTVVEILRYYTYS